MFLDRIINRVGGQDEVAGSDAASISDWGSPWLADNVLDVRLPNGRIGAATKPFLRSAKSLFEFDRGTHIGLDRNRCRRSYREFDGAC